MCYGDPSATEVPPCCETATKKFTFSTTSVLLLLNMPLSLSRATIFRRQKNPRRVYRPKIAGILFVCNELEGKYYTVPDPDRGPPFERRGHTWFVSRAILRYSFCRGRDILDIHPSITLSILLVEHSYCTYMEAVTYVFQCVINIFCK